MSNDLSPRRQRSDGIRTREAILQEAARLATVEGIEGLSLGRLADSVGMSKSGLFAHFRSKEELQLATIETADAIFQAEVVDPALARAPGDRPPARTLRGVPRPSRTRCLSRRLLLRLGRSRDRHSPGAGTRLRIHGRCRLVQPPRDRGDRSTGRAHAQRRRGSRPRSPSSSTPTCSSRTPSTSPPAIRLHSIAPGARSTGASRS